MNTNETNPEFFNKNSNDNHEIVTHDPGKKNNKKIITITISTILAILLIIGIVFGIIAAVGGKEEQYQYPIGNGDEVFNTEILGEINEIHAIKTYEEKNSKEEEGWKINRNLKTENLAEIFEGTLDSNYHAGIIETNNFNELFTQYASSIQHYEESIKADYLFLENDTFTNEKNTVTTNEVNFYLKNFTYLWTYNNQVGKEISIDNLTFESLYEEDINKQLDSLTIVVNVNNLKVDDKTPLSFNLKGNEEEPIPTTDFNDMNWDFNNSYDEKFHFNFI